LIVIRGDGPLDDDAVARLWADMAAALLAAHQVGVLHRDIEPGNILIDSDGTPWLIDFGIARTSGDVTVSENRCGDRQPSYLPPEVAAGKPVGCRNSATGRDLPSCPRNRLSSHHVLNTFIRAMRRKWMFSHDDYEPSSGA
jgi:serine/threonine protein kinase